MGECTEINDDEKENPVLVKRPRRLTISRCESDYQSLSRHSHSQSTVRPQISYPHGRGVSSHVAQRKMVVTSLNTLYLRGRLTGGLETCHTLRAKAKVTLRAIDIHVSRHFLSLRA